MKLAEKRLRRDEAKQLSIAALAARGKADDIKSQIKQNWGYD